MNIAVIDDNTAEEKRLKEEKERSNKERIAGEKKALWKECESYVKIRPKRQEDRKEELITFGSFVYTEDEIYSSKKMNYQEKMNYVKDLIEKHKLKVIKDKKHIKSFFEFVKFILGAVIVISIGKYFLSETSYALAHYQIGTLISIVIMFFICLGIGAALMIGMLLLTEKITIFLQKRIS